MNVCGQFRSLCLPEAWRETVWAGLGFGLGFGWLWFSGLHAYWLPLFLWGAPDSVGGTTLFLGVLLAGYVLAWSLPQLFKVWRPPFLAFESADDGPCLTYNSTNCLHGAAVMLLVGVLVWGRHDSLVASCLPPLCAALAACLLGLFWMAALLRLRPGQAAMAFCLACGVALCQSVACEWLPFRYGALLLFGAMGGAWGVALLLTRDAQRAWTAQKNKKRPRGRPSKTVTVVPSVHAWPLLALPAFILLVLSFGESQAIVHGSVAVRLPGWLINALTGSGALAAMGVHLVRAHAHDELDDENAADTRGLAALWLKMLTLIGGIGLTLLLVPAWILVAVPLLEGALCVLALLLLAKMPAENVRAKAGVALSVALCAGYAGLLLHLMLDRAMAWLAPSLCNELFITRVIGLGLLAAWAVLHWRYRNVPLQAGWGRQTPEDCKALLTPREKEVIAQVCAGQSNQNIAEALKISEAGVRFHLKNIYKKTGLKNRDELTLHKLS